ncbi:MAG TPA: PQQ-binding-like beta-propeller repeat protein [Anaerolineales bacterium]|nr:PQQ-binding-like beta-propeller repeat protein [Anaerolineales bacterium]
MTDDIREHKCPNCGAPLGIPQEHERYFKCTFCGTVLEDRATKEEQETGVFNIRISKDDISAAQQARLETYSAPPVITSYASGYTPTATGNRIGCIITTVILLFVGSILFFTIVPTLAATGAIAVFFRSLGIETDRIPLVDDDDLGGLRLYSFGPTAMLPSDNDTTPDFVAVARASDETERLVYVDLENDPELRWMVEVTGEDVTYVYSQFLSDGTRLYFSASNRIMAFNRLQGTLLWESALSDEIQHNICPGCFQLFGDTIVTLSAGGTLEAWDAATGARRWEVRLNKTPRQIVNFGGQPGVLDQDDDHTYFNVFNLADGSLADRFVPACPNEPFPDDPQELGIYDMMLGRPEGNGAYFFAGIFDPGCVQYWTPGAAQPAWTATYRADIGRNIEHGDLVLAEDALYIAVTGGTYTVDLANGAFTVLHENADYNFSPIGARDGVLVLMAERTRGTRRWEVWGLDAALGNVKWTFLPQAADYFDGESSPLFAAGDWTAGLTPAGLTVVQLFDELPRAVIQTIPLQSGTASEPLTFHFSDIPGGHWIDILGWRGSEFWVTEATNLFVIDITSGEAAGRWP